MAPKSTDIYSQAHAQGKAGAQNIVSSGRPAANQHIVDE